MPDINPIVRDLEAASYDDVFEVGAVYQLPLILYDSAMDVIDLSNVIAEYTVLPYFGSPLQYVHLLSGVDAGCTIDGPNGTLTIDWDYRTLTTKFRRAVYDIFLTDNITGLRLRLVHGSLSGWATSSGSI